MKAVLRIFATLLVASACVLACTACGDGSQQELPQGGSPGTGETGQSGEKPADEAVTISSSADWMNAAAKIAADTDGYATRTFRLTADIILGAGVTPIQGFRGVLDGQFHTVSGISVYSDGASVGLFASLDGATVKNLCLVSGRVTATAAGARAGILAGTATDCEISCVTVIGPVTAGGTDGITGGIVGTADGTTLTNVHSAATVTGTEAGGVAGRITGGTMVVNAYAAATVSAPVAGTVAGSKAADSAVAFCLSVDSGETVGRIESVVYLPDYIIGCKAGVDAGEMHWDTADWDIGGEKPRLRTDSAKTHVAPVVTVDGTPVPTVWGEKVPVPVWTDTGNGCVTGYRLNGETWYAALPVLCDMALETERVDGSLLTGTWIGIRASAGNLTVDGASLTATAAGTNLTRVGLTAADGMPTAYYTGTDGKVYRLTVTCLSDAEKALYGFTAVPGAAWLTLDRESTGTGTFATVAAYMPVPAAACGAWSDGTVTTVYSPVVTAVSGANYYRGLTVGNAPFTYRTCYAVRDGAVTLTADGRAVTVMAGAATLTGTDGAVLTPAMPYYNGTWFDGAGHSVTVADGKINATPLTLAVTANGTGYRYETGGTEITLIAGLSGLTAYADGTGTVLVSGDFGGEWLTLMNGAEYSLTVVGDRVYVNGDTTASATAAYTVIDGVVNLRVTVDGTTYAYVREGLCLKESTGNGRDLYAATAIRRFFGTYYLGSRSFTLAATLTELTDGVPAAAVNLSVCLSGQTLSLTVGTYTFSFAGQSLILTDSSGGDTASVPLLTEERRAGTVNGYRGDYVAPGIGLSDPALSVSMTADGILAVNGQTTAYTFFESDGTVCIRFMSGDSTVTLQPITAGFFRVTGYAGVGHLMPAPLADTVGGYCEFLAGATDAGATMPGIITLSPYGTLTLPGHTYLPGEYAVTVADSTVLLTLRGTGDANDDMTVTFTRGKTLSYGGRTYTGYDKILPGEDYIQVGDTTAAWFSILSGSLGGWEDEEETVWTAPVYPLFGVRYTCGGKTYTSDSFTYLNDAGTVILTVRASTDADEEIVLTVTCRADAPECLTVRVGGGDETVFYPADTVRGMTGTYQNGAHTVICPGDGTLTVNGEATAYTLRTDAAGGVYALTVGERTYVIDRATPEVMTCGTEILYDTYFARFAGLNLTGYRQGDATPDNQYTLILTENGFCLNGERVAWTDYDPASGNLRFTVTETVGGAPARVLWTVDAESMDKPYGLCLCPDSGDTAPRWFIPAVLAGSAGAYATATGHATLIAVSAPDYTDGFLPPVITVNGVAYSAEAYEVASVDGTLIVSVDSYTVSYRTEAGVTVLCLDGQETVPYSAPDITGFTVTGQRVSGSLVSRETVSITADGWIVTDGGTDRYESGEYGFGKFGNYNVMFMNRDATGAASYVAIRADGTVYVMTRDLYDLLGCLTDEAGSEVTVTPLFIGNGEVGITIGHGGNTATNVTCGVLPDGQRYIRYLCDGGTYIVIRNTHPGTCREKPVLVATETVFRYVTRCDLPVGGQLRICLGWDTAEERVTPVCYNTGNGDKEVTLTPADGQENTYTFSYTYNGKLYGAVVRFAPEASDGYTVQVYSYGAYAYVGTYTVDGVTVAVTLETVTDGDGTTVQAFCVAYGTNGKVTATVAPDGAYMTFSLGGTVYTGTVRTGTLTLTRGSTGE